MKFKSLFSGIIFAVGMSVVIGTCINNTKADTYGDWGYEKNWQGYTISTYTGNDTEVTIPFDLGGISNEYVRIKTGSDESNENLKKVKKVTFGSGYTHINGYAIAGFENVEEVVIPEGVTELEAYAFRKLTNLKKVQFPSTLKKIGENAFRECSSLESVTLKDGLETIKWGVFEDCKGLKSVTVPDSAEMEYDVFRNCLGLKDENGMVIVNGHLYHMDIPSGVTEITIPDGIKVLDGELFYY
ncbi:MAG: leucine-rich repeat domain-containing protein, partial [Clostridiales bacterium]|nr:leucine-rich repeat domain-containing protein [Clostridiales bacterium]